MSLMMRKIAALLMAALIMFPVPVLAQGSCSIYRSWVT